MENKNIEKQSLPDEIDAKIHQRILIEEFIDDHWYAFSMKWYRGIDSALAK